MQKNSKPETVEFSQQVSMRPQRLKRKGAATPPASTGFHTISQRQEDPVETQVSLLSDIARTFNECLCEVPPISQKGNCLCIRSRQNAKFNNNLNYILGQKGSKGEKGSIGINGIKG